MGHLFICALQTHHIEHFRGPVSASLPPLQSKSNVLSNRKMRENSIVLKYEAHEHADDLGQGLNDTLSERMFEMTGRPSRCPHGEPIPDAEGNLPELNDICIVNLSVGHKGEVSRVKTHEPEKLRYFASLGLMPGAAREIVARAPFNGPIRLRVGREEDVLGMDLAKSLWVT